MEIHSSKVFGLYYLVGESKKTNKKLAISIKYIRIFLSYELTDLVSFIFSDSSIFSMIENF